MKNNRTKLTSLGICAVLLISVLSGCGAQGGDSNPSGSFSENNFGGSTDAESTFPSEDTTQSPEASAESNAVSAENTLPSASSVTYTEFAVRLFRESLEPENNTLISPLSVINALAMTANGAKGETLWQMETLFGADIASLSEFLRDYNASLPYGEKYKLHIADSIWLKDEDDTGYTVEESFLQTNSNLFNAEIYRTAFDDSSLKDINQWVAESTDDMIPEILDEISEDAVMYLINALAFDAQWQSPYESYMVQDDIFTREDGTEQTVKMMYSNEDILLQDFNEKNELTAQGFLKFYADEKYALAVLMPEEGISIADYVASLSGESLGKILSDTSEAYIEAGLPKFESEYSVDLKNILSDMGMTAAVSPDTADFTGISPDGRFYIGGVLHKTYIAVDEEGTRAGASTVVEMRCESSISSPDAVRIILNRPFVYMIIDCEENLPVFIGTVMRP